jgi:DNA-directed RNA polymerase subunit RPC12/RpoP
MEYSISSPKIGIENPHLSATQASSICRTCGEEYKTPLLAMVSSGILVEEYYACPKCLSKVESVERQKSVEVDEAEEEEEALKMEIKDTLEENVACTHNLGYLKWRPKNTPIPDECLTCSKMIECMCC